MPSAFMVTVESDKATGKVQAVYLKLRTSKVAKTKEYNGGDVLVDLDSRGLIVGVEMLAPCDVQVIERIARSQPIQERAKTRRFLKESAPRAMLVG